MYQRYSTGAADDLVKVTNIARSMVARYGMDDTLGHLSFEEERTPFLNAPGTVAERAYSEDTARAIDRSARDIANAAFERAVAILRHNRAILEQGARELLAKETLSESEIASLARSLARPPY
jgi:cell division protease FtsH